MATDLVLDSLDTDILVLGAGGAGLCAALHIADRAPRLTVTVAQAADFPKCDHITLGDGLHASVRWRVFRQREMCSRSVIVRKVSGQDSTQVLLAEYHHVVQAVAPD